jgi:hypothetical protein
LKRFLLFLFLLPVIAVKAQHIDSIYANLYTDSLKKGTYNYINIDGLLSNGRYMPLDSTHILFSATAGKFYGNSLLVDRNFTGDKITIKAVLRKNPSVWKEFTLYIKIKADNENLKSVEELYGIPPPKPKRKKG